jgi:hypothetical protein
MVARLSQLAGGPFFSASGLIVRFQFLQLRLWIMKLSLSFRQTLLSTLERILLGFQPLLGLLQVRLQVLDALNQ